MDFRKDQLLAILMFILIAPVISNAWYYNISIDATKNFFFEGLKIDLNYTFYEFGRTKRGLLVLEIENSTNTTVKISPPQFDEKEFYLSPDQVFKKPVKLHQGQRLAFYTFTLPTTDTIIFEVSDKDFIIPMNWTVELYEKKKWNWFATRVGRVSSLFFWISVILYVSNRVKNM